MVRRVLCVSICLACAGCPKSWLPDTEAPRAAASPEPVKPAPPPTEETEVAAQPPTEPGKPEPGSDPGSDPNEPSSPSTPAATADPPDAEDTGPAEALPPISIMVSYTEEDPDAPGNNLRFGPAFPPIVEDGHDSRVIEARGGKLAVEAHGCYADALPDHPEARGEILSTLVLTERGRVDEVRLEVRPRSNGLEEAGVPACMEEVYRKARFKEAARGGFLRIMFLMARRPPR